MHPSLVRDAVPIEGYPGLFVRPVLVADMLNMLAMDEQARGARLVELAIVDSDGRRVLEDGEARQLQLPVYLDLLRAANAINGEGEDAVEQAEGN